MSTTKPQVTIFWHRRDLRTDDNIGLQAALKSKYSVVPIFIFDTEILDELPSNDARVTFIYDQLLMLREDYKSHNGNLKIIHSSPSSAFEELIQEFEVMEVHTNRDYEPYAISRDKSIEQFLKSRNISFYSYKDQVVHEENDILKKDGTPYTVYTPYRNAWMERGGKIKAADTHLSNLFSAEYHFPSLQELGFERSEINIPNYRLNNLDQYKNTRDFPAKDATSYLSTHLRFGTVSIRRIIEQVKPSQTSFLNELIWREFFMQILYHFPQVVSESFRVKYDDIQWRNNEQEFEAWCQGRTGYPLVDAGMRELNQTGFMHNRVRMVVASFLCKHLLIDWRWGEAYFAEKLLDFDLSANNGNWQWAAGTGCDAAPYFRVFNPSEQQKKFDPKFEYIRKWIPEIDSFEYPAPIVEHKFARERALKIYREALK